MAAKNASQEFLDASQYTESGILHYEFVFGGIGAGFISTGGIDSTRVIFNENPLIDGARVLDVGCGIGGPAKFLNDTFNATVLGVDLSSNCVSIANKRNVSTSMNFIVADAVTYPFEDNHFDLVYSRDVILHIASKDILFDRLLKATKPGGKLVMTVYCCGPQENWDEEFESYVAQRGYHLLTVEQYKGILEQAGWIVDRAEDKTAWFQEILQAEKARAIAQKAEFLAQFQQEDFDHLMEGWNNKLMRVPKGHQRWGYFVAHKPVN